MLRHALRMRRDPLGYLQLVSQRYGSLVEFPMPGRRVVFANSPELVQTILQTRHRQTSRDTIQYRSLALVTGNGLLTSSGDEWRRQRRLMQPAFHRGSLDRFVGSIDRGLDSLTAEWEALPTASTVDIDDAMMRTSLEVIGHALFSHDLSADAGDLVHAVLEALDVVVAKARSPLPVPVAWPTPANRRLARSVAVLDRTVDRMMEARRAADDDCAGTDLLGLLLAAHEGDDHFTDEQVRDEAVTLIVAGHETVASSLTWTWHLLAGHPLIERRLHEEIDAVLGDRRATFADLAQLPYTRAVVDEALRLYPPAWVISRRLTEPIELDGHVLEEGTDVFVSPYVLQRSPQWWTQPDEFIPDRFLGEGPADRYSYIPFGAGPSLCIGRDLALVEAVLVVAEVARSFRLMPVPGQSIQADPLVTIRPRGGLPMVLQRRTSGRT
jgi:cytochrome P450